MGCHPSSSRVQALDAGASAPMKAAEEPEVLERVLGGDGEHRDVQVLSDHLGDPSDRHAFLSDRVERRSGRGLLQCQAEQPRRIEAVGRRPAVGPVAHVARGAPVARDADQGRHEAVVPVPVTGRWKAHDRGADAVRSEGERDLRRAQPGQRPPPSAAAAGSDPLPVLFGRHPARRESDGPRGDEERSIGSCEGLSERLDGTAVGIGSALEVSREGHSRARTRGGSRRLSPPRRPAGSSRSSSVPGRTSAPAVVIAWPEASERASPTTSWPASMSSGTTAEPIQPDAPVTKTRMRTSRWRNVPATSRQGRCQLLSSP